MSTSSSRCLMVSSWLGLRVRFLKMLISASQSGGAGSPSAWGLSVLHRLLLRPLHTGIVRHVWHGCCPAIKQFDAPWADPALGLILKGMSRRPGARCKVSAPFHLPSSQHEQKFTALRLLLIHLRVLS